MAVLQKIKALQTACQRANIPVPLDAVLRRERSLRLPGVQPEGQQPEGKGAAAAKKKKKKAEEGEEQEEGTTKETATPAVTGTPAAAAPAPAAVTTTTTEAAAAGAAGQRRGVVRRPPQTVAEWLHLLSPLLTLVFGVLYALARAVGKQGQEGAA